MLKVLDQIMEIAPKFKKTEQKEPWRLAKLVYKSGRFFSESWTIFKNMFQIRRRLAEEPFDSSTMRRNNSVSIISSTCTERDRAIFSPSVPYLPVLSLCKPFSFSVIVIISGRLVSFCANLAVMSSHYLAQCENLQRENLYTKGKVVW